MKLLELVHTNLELQNYYPTSASSNALLFMSEDTQDDLPKETSESLDLSALSSVDFGPSWADGTARKGSGKRHKDHTSGKGEGFGKKKGSGYAGRDRRPSRSRGEGHDSARGAHASSDGIHGNRERHGRNRRNSEGRSQIFEPTVKIDIYPQDEAFNALVKRLQSTARTYQLFEITKLLLEKYERFIVVVSPLSRSKNEESRKMYYSVPGHLPFETEDAAVNHALSHHIDLYFDTETIEVEPPKGNFQMINRCPFTGELLGPPNYHRYQEFLQQHYANRVSGISLEKYLQKIEAVKEQEVIDAWVESMKQSVRYTAKEPVEGAPTTFDTLESARLFLLQYHKSAVVSSGDSVRFAGRDLERLPVGDIRRSVESFVEQQRHFPLETANNIRGRLRRHNFTIYKKGAKGASFVCAVKRRFRELDTVFTSSIQGLIDFIEKKPEVKASELAHAYLGFEAPKNKSTELKLSEAELVEAKTLDVESSEAETPEAEAIGEAVEVSSDTDAASPEAQDTPEASTDSKEAGAGTEPAAVLTEEQEAAFKQLRVDLHWLVTEGYVTEYGDGRLYAPAAMPPAKAKIPEAAKDNSSVAVEAAKTEEPLTAAVEANATDDPEQALASDGSAPITEPAAEAPTNELEEVASEDSAMDSDSAEAEEEPKA